jgi:hypothetical protein
MILKQQKKEQMKAGAPRWKASGKSFGHGPGEQKETKGHFKTEEGKVGWILLWALGIPIPILLILFVLRGCT